jgi:ArsR family transcriptional regulator, virulence genes transcriptional regulator
MEREREEQLYRLQADLCRVLAEPTRLKLLSLLGERPHAVKDLFEATGERQAKISQHLTIMRQHVGTEAHYTLADPRILEACRITRDVLLQQLTRGSQPRLKGLRLLDVPGHPSPPGRPERPWPPFRIPPVVHPCSRAHGVVLPVRAADKPSR